MSSIRLLPVRPSNPRCPTCKAFIGINPLGLWSVCRACGMSFRDLDGRHAHVALENTIRIVPDCDVLTEPEQRKFISSIEPFSNLKPNGKIRKKREQTLVDQLSLFGGAL